MSNTQTNKNLEQTIYGVKSLQDSHKSLYLEFFGVTSGNHYEQAIGGRTENLTDKDVSEIIKDKYDYAVKFSYDILTIYAYIAKTGKSEQKFVVPINQSLTPEVQPQPQQQLQINTIQKMAGDYLEGLGGLSGILEGERVKSKLESRIELLEYQLNDWKEKNTELKNEIKELEKELQANNKTDIGELMLGLGGIARDILPMFKKDSGLNGATTNDTPEVTNIINWIRTLTPEKMNMFYQITAFVSKKDTDLAMVYELCTGNTQRQTQKQAQRQSTVTVEETDEQSE